MKLLVLGILVVLPIFAQDDLYYTTFKSGGRASNCRRWNALAYQTWAKENFFAGWNEGYVFDKTHVEEFEPLKSYTASELVKTVDAFCREPLNAFIPLGHVFLNWLPAVASGKWSKKQLDDYEISLRNQVKRLIAGGGQEVPR